MPKITLKNIKIARHLSQETEAFTASVYLDSKRIGDVRNDGNGGCHMIHIDSPHHDAFNAVVESEWTGDKIYETAKSEELINRLLEQHEIADHQKRIIQQRKRWTKTQVVFRIQGDEDGNFRTVKHKGRIAEAKNMVRRKYGDKIIEMYPE